MLYGDDDTLFFVDAVLDLLLPFDPELPYAISDNIWFEANSAQASHHDLLARVDMSVIHAVYIWMQLFSTIKRLVVQMAGCWLKKTCVPDCCMHTVCRLW